MKTKSMKHLIAAICMAAAALSLSGCSEPPDDVIQQAIIDDHDALKEHVYELTRFEVTNSYEREISGETATVVEYTGETKLANRNLNLGFGITLKDNDTVQGTIVLVKRGNSWYAL